MLDDRRVDGQEDDREIEGKDDQSEGEVESLHDDCWNLWNRKKWQLTFRQAAVVARHYRTDRLAVAGHNGASTLQIANLRFVFAFPGCERQLAVC